MKRIKVIHLITGLNTGGAEMMLYKTVSKVDKNRYSQIVISMIKPGHIGELIKKENIPVISLNFSKGISIISGFLKLVKILLKEKPEIIHSYMFHADILGRVAGKLCGIKIIISSLRNENIGGRKREILLKYTNKIADIVTAVCYAAAEKQIERGSITRDKLKVIYNGVDLELFQKSSEQEIMALKEELSLKTVENIILTVGRLEPQKNHELLINSFGKLLNKHPNSVLLIAGEGKLRIPLEKQVKDLGLTQNIRLLGVRKDIPKLLSMADAFVLASKYEGMPNVVIEAMASAIPVIATSVGGTPEIIINQSHGLLIKPDDVNSLTVGLDKILNLSKEKRKEIGENGRVRIEKFFTIDKTVNETENLYEHLLEIKEIV